MASDQPDIRVIGTSAIPDAIEVWRTAGLDFESAGRDSVDSLSTQLNTDSTFVLGFYEGPRMVGVVLGTDDGRKGWINRLAVVPDRHRSGIGRALIRACETLFMQRGIRVVACLVYDANEPSRHMFQEAGYELRRDIAYLRKELGQ